VRHTYERKGRPRPPLRATRTWNRLTEARQVSSQVVTKPQGGRPESGVKRFQDNLSKNLKAGDNLRRIRRVSSPEAKQKEVLFQLGTKPLGGRWRRNGRRFLFEDENMLGHFSDAMMSSTLELIRGEERGR
jgi:hypothetical protein